MHLEELKDGRTERKTNPTLFHFFYCSVLLKHIHIENLRSEGQYLFLCISFRMSLPSKKKTVLENMQMFKK